MIVSISGMDNSGKTTQCDLLSRMYPQVFPIVLHIQDMPSFDKQKCNEEWWFGVGNEETFVRTIFSCLKERIETAQQYDSKLVLFDKGTDFYDARMIAALIMKGMKFKEALAMVYEIKSNYLDDDYESLKFFLESGHYIRKELDKNNWKDLRYNAYIELNKLVLKDMHFDYIHIPANDIHVVTGTILGCIDYNLEGKKEYQCIQKRLIRNIEHH